MATTKPTVEIVKEALQDRGFVETANNKFAGIIDCEEFGTLPVTLTFPAGFPRHLPKVAVSRNALRHRIPHHEEDENLCLFRNTGLLVDVERPIDVLDETLMKARKSVLLPGLRRENLDDFIEEFQAYWNSNEHSLSICDPFLETREIVRAGISRRFQNSYSLFADSDEQVLSWCSKLGHNLVETESSFFVQLAQPFYPPSFGTTISNKELYVLLNECSSEEAAVSFDKWLFHCDLPRLVILSLPASVGTQRTLVGIRIERASGKALSKAQSGFRPGFKVQGAKEFHLSVHNPTKKITIDRLDSAFTLPRGGSQIDLMEKTVVALGCGAIGSRVAEKLASSGVGTIRIVDKEDFSVENLYRHQLAIDDLGSNKAEAMCAQLDRRFPEQVHEFRNRDIESLLVEEPNFIYDADLVVVTVGDDNLELFLNEQFPKKMPRLHVWVEPLSLGGHLLLKVSHESGCFRCIFRRSSEHGLYNASSFAAPSQNFQRSHSGCAGVFTPFSSLDADKAANEAVRRSIDFIMGGTDSNALISWLTRKWAFKSEGLKLSKRGEMFSEDEMRVEKNFYDDSCDYCGSL